MQSRGVPCICRGTGQGHSARSPSCAKKWADCSPGKCFCVCNCIFLLCLLLGARWHHDCTFLLLLEMWQTQDADSQFVPSYMIALPRSWAYHYILINTHWMRLSQWGGMAATCCHSWWRWWSDTLWMTLTRLWPTYSCHGYFGLARSNSKWLPLKYFFGVPSAISLIILFLSLCFSW
jgi:hypothetical protein